MKKSGTQETMRRCLTKVKETKSITKAVLVIAEEGLHV